jgi:hypothetical protein
LQCEQQQQAEHDGHCDQQSQDDAEQHAHLMAPASLCIRDFAATSWHHGTTALAIEQRAQRGCSDSREETLPRNESVVFVKRVSD